MIFTASHLQWEKNDELADWRVPEKHGEVRSFSSGPDSYVLFLGDQPSWKEGFCRESANGSTFLYHGDHSVNGFSGVRHDGLKKYFGFTYNGWTSPALIPKLFEKDDLTGLEMTELFRIGTIVVQKGEHGTLMEEHKSDRWVPEREGMYTKPFVSSSPPPARPGQISWLPPGMSVETVIRAEDEREIYEIASEEAFGGGPLLFARPIWNGHWAELNGTPLPVSGYKDRFLRVEIPPGAQGQRHGGGGTAPGKTCPTR